VVPQRIPECGLRICCLESLESQSRLAASKMASTGSALFLHGVAAIDGTIHGDTWQWAGGEWKTLQEIGPAPRIQHAMAFDTNQSRLVLFGARMRIARSPIRGRHRLWSQGRRRSDMFRKRSCAQPVSKETTYEDFKTSCRRWHGDMT
jgi:hypothetical protein